VPLFDYQCQAHGIIRDSYTGKCPHGCDKAFVQKVFLKAPGLKSDRTKNIDSTVRDLAADYGLTNLNNQNGTSACVRPDWRKERERNDLIGKLGDTSGAWGQIPGGKIGDAMSANHATPGDTLSAVQPLLHAPRPGVVARYDAKIAP
jgi:hypothetical protein